MGCLFEPKKIFKTNLSEYKNLVMLISKTKSLKTKVKRKKTKVIANERKLKVVNDLISNKGSNTVAYRGGGQLSPPSAKNL